MRNRLLRIIKYNKQEGFTSKMQESKQTNDTQENYALDRGPPP